MDYINDDDVISIYSKISFYLIIPYVCKLNIKQNENIFETKNDSISTSKNNPNPHFFNGQMMQTQFLFRIKFFFVQCFADKSLRIPNKLVYLSIDRKSLNGVLSFGNTFLRLTYAWCLSFIKCLSISSLSATTFL